MGLEFGASHEFETHRLHCLEQSNRFAPPSEIQRAGAYGSICLGPISLGAYSEEQAVKRKFGKGANPMLISEQD